MANDNPLVCVVVPTLNEAKYIRESIDSLIAQDYYPLKIVVYDGGSTDGTLEILKSYPVEVIVEPGLGQMAAINRGWRQSEAEFVTWWAGDDVYRPGAITRLAAELKEHPNVGFVYADADIINGKGELTMHLTPGHLQLRDIVMSFPIIPQSTLIRRSALARSGLMDETRRLVADWDLFLRLSQYYPMHYVEFTASARRIHPDSEDAKNLVEGADAVIDVINCFFERPDLTDEQRLLHNRGIAASHIAAGWKYYWTGQRRIAWQMVGGAARAYLPSMWATQAGPRLLMRLLLPPNVDPAKWVTLKRAINRVTHHRL